MEPDEPTKSHLRQSRHNASQALAATLCIVTLSAVVLRLRPPEIASFYPECPFHQWTGLLCPGCGATRAVAALLQGHVAEAMRWNSLVVLALPIALIMAGNAYSKATRGEDPWPSIPPTLIAAALGVSAVFAVARNLL